VCYRQVANLPSIANSISNSLLLSSNSDWLRVTQSSQASRLNTTSAYTASLWRINEAAENAPKSKNGQVYYGNEATMKCRNGACMSLVGVVANRVGYRTS